MLFVIHQVTIEGVFVFKNIMPDWLDHSSKRLGPRSWCLQENTKHFMHRVFTKNTLFFIHFCQFICPLYQIFTKSCEYGFQWKFRTLINNQGIYFLTSCKSKPSKVSIINAITLSQAAAFTWSISIFPLHSSFCFFL